MDFVYEGTRAIHRGKAATGNRIYESQISKAERCQTSTPYETRSLTTAFLYLFRPFSRSSSSFVRATSAYRYFLFFPFSFFFFLFSFFLFSFPSLFVEKLIEPLSSSSFVRAYLIFLRSMFILFISHELRISEKALGGAPQF